MSGPGKFEIRWVKRGGPPQQPPNPDYPEGCHVDLTEHGQSTGKVKRTTPAPDTLAEQSCSTPLPYPTGKDEIGGWFVRCLTCDLKVFVTAASRPDDPCSVRVACMGGKETLQ